MYGKEKKIDEGDIWPLRAYLSPKLPDVSLVNFLQYSNDGW